MTPGTDMVIGFRTHVWNEDVAFLARRLFSYAIGARFVVLVDETSGALDTAPFEKVSHTSDFSEFGLPNFPHGQVLWYNADYPLYVLRQAFPDAAAYAMIEFDVAVNVDMVPIMSRAIADGIDLIAHRLDQPPVWWTWEEWTGRHFETPIRLLLPIMILSARAIDTLFARRKAMCAAKPPETPADWAYCEVFIPSVIAETEGYRIADIRDFARLPYYTFRDPLNIREPMANTPGNICHPVLGGMTFIAKRIAQDAPEAIFDPASMLRRQLAFCDPADFMPVLAARIKALRSVAMLAGLQALAGQEGWPAGDLRSNAAFGKPATQSSTTPWWDPGEPEKNAMLGNDGNIGRTYGFQTGREQDPWWQVDLRDHVAVGSVTIFNRIDVAERGIRMRILSSSDGQSWQVRGTKPDDSEFGGADGNPYVFTFVPCFPARYIRVQMLGEGMLHLDEIEVYGDLAVSGHGQDDADSTIAAPQAGID